MSRASVPCLRPPQWCTARSGRNRYLLGTFSTQGTTRLHQVRRRRSHPCLLACSPKFQSLTSCSPLSDAFSILSPSFSLPRFFLNALRLPLSVVSFVSSFSPSLLSSHPVRPFFVLFQLPRCWTLPAYIRCNSPASPIRSLYQGLLSRLGASTLSENNINPISN